MIIEKTYQTVRLVLGDQLNIQHSWFKNASEKKPHQVNDDTLYVIAELKQEATYVKHHIQKICAFFAAMESFSKELAARGYHVLYLTLDDTANFSSLNELITTIVTKAKAQTFAYQQPDEYRLQQQLRFLAQNASFQDQGIELIEASTDHFLIDFADIPHYIKPDQHNLMETFYRKMRKKFGILMNGDQPLGGKWNYDAENRKKFKAGDYQYIPQPLVFSNDVSAYLARIEKHQIPYFGKKELSIVWPQSRAQSLSLLEYFCENCLPNFGNFQDAMTTTHPYQWSLYHSRLSFTLNSKMISPAEVIQAAIIAYEAQPNLISLAQIEGFIRQILGWREYIRCVYWVNMPNYKKHNHLNAQQHLPEYFWSGNTKMACMNQAISQSLDYAYAHHIQRLMVTGNFCLLTGIQPDEVDAWYLGIYIDAIEWVEMPNTRGMSLFADGGYVATKPYSSSGNYINKMSDYCRHCFYDVKQKTTRDACPFNSLYWVFMNKHRQRLATNPRSSMVYRNWDKQNDEKKQAILQRGQWCLSHLEEL